MLSYSSCSEFWKCPFAFQHRHDQSVVEQRNTFLQLGSNYDKLLNILGCKLMREADLREKKRIELEIDDMQWKMILNGDACEYLNVPRTVKEWFIDLISSGLTVVDVQRHFYIPHLDYHGYIDMLLKDKDGKLIVVENKTTSKFYDKFMSSKKESYQAIGYCIAENTREVCYNFFDTVKGNQYASYRKNVTDEEVKEFTEWVQFVRDNENSFIKNKEWCSLNNCIIKEECTYGF